MTAFADHAHGETETAPTATAVREEGDAAPTLSVAGISMLQRTAGNAAVCRLLSRARTLHASRPTLARFVGFEHKELGDTTGASINLGNGVTLSWGDVVAPALVAGELLDRIGRRHASLLSEAADGRSTRPPTALSVAPMPDRF